MSTGIQADSTLSEFYNNEFKKESNKGRYIILKISDDKKFIQLEKSSEDPTFESYLADLTKSGLPRFSVLKFKYESNDGRPCEKLISITWIPDTCGVKEKMVYAGSKDALKKVLQGIMVQVNATDLSELSLKILADACTRV
eukprot:gene23821-32208_t